MDWKLEVVVVPVSDVDRAKQFYSEQVGFVVDVDHRANDKMRVVQLTPPGSACSISIGTGLVDSAPGSLKGLQLVVPDIEAARVELLERGVEVGPIRHVDKDGVWVDGKGGEWNSFVFFSDPDGNGWIVQEAPPALLSSWPIGLGPLSTDRWPDGQAGQRDPPRGTMAALSKPAVAHAGGPMIGRRRIPRDPFEGQAARRKHLRLRIEGLMALGMAIGACGLTAAMWLRVVAPFAHKFGLN